LTSIVLWPERGPALLQLGSYAREVVEIAGATIPGGELVLAVLGSANHDENHFEDPDTLELARDPNRHLAFGRGGVHHIAWGRHSPGWKER
jgi:cytochrome P450 PksS